MSPKDRYEELRKDAYKETPNYQELIRQEYIKAIKEAQKRAVLDLDNLGC